MNDAYEFLLSLTRQGGFTPHAFCLAYDDFALYGMILGHRLIELAYFMIPVQLCWAIWRRTHGSSLVIKHEVLLFSLFGGFIFSCMIGHRIEELNFRFAYYRLEALWHIWTGLISMATACALPFLIRFQPTAERTSG